MVTPKVGVVAVMAHPDDAEIWAGGTLALHARIDGAAIVVHKTSPTRSSEARLGAETLGVQLNEIDVYDPVALHECLHALQPRVVITHHVDDPHPDHRSIATALIACLPALRIATGLPRAVYMCDCYESMSLRGPVDARTIVDITTTFARKLDALRHHKSQPIDHWDAMCRRLCGMWGARIGVQWAEAFQAIPLVGQVPGVGQL